jgi:hypothetical protein
MCGGRSCQPPFRLEDCAADDFGDLRDDGVSEGSKAVHPRGNPMSHSTHVGFSAPPAALGSRIATTVSRFGNRSAAFWTAVTVIVAAIAEHERGVGQSFAKEARDGECRRYSDGLPLSFQSRAAGVGHMPLAFAAFRLLLPPSSPVVLGVGHKPESVSLVRGANGGSWYAVPFRVIPERGQVSENSAKPPSKES